MSPLGYLILYKSRVELCYNEIRPEGGDFSMLIVPEPNYLKTYSDQLLLTIL